MRALQTVTSSSRAHRLHHRIFGLHGPGLPEIACGSDHDAGLTIVRNRAGLGPNHHRAGKVSTVLEQRE